MWLCHLFSEVTGRGRVPNVVTNSYLMDGYFKLHSFKTGFELHKEMLSNNISPNIISYTILFDGLCEKGMTKEALLVFYSASRCGFLPDVITYEFCSVGFASLGFCFEMWVYKFPIICL
ncbi:unnamed protein product [Cuscuta epithymum]|uniref:Pentatricopeptide repeat-containing protein n=1 Tax=Cuscuta epithymum TaxID=186058 RepID=A0AAV0GI33_9ASTE|nr:unnamed protein product [Cuscuta epithymum]